MPSSVVFAALVLAWLVVLVPVVARRRQMVPRPAEADLSAKVLPRTVGASPVKTPMEEVPMADAHLDRSAGSRGATALAEREDVDQELDRELELDAYDGEGVEESVGESEEPDVRAAGSRERVLDRRAERRDEDDADMDAYDEDDEDDGEPRTYRPGRGGFDPQAAAAAAHVRHVYRQRVALGLIAVAVLSAIAALVVSPTLWWLHVATDLVLVGYLVFLRRQTRIEEEVRARRAARLSGERRALEARRERQAVHDDRMAEYRRDTEAWSPGPEDDDVAPAEDHEGWDDADPEPRWAAPRTPAPPVPAGMELVEDSDDDPAFHDLDDRDRMPAYRRAAAGA